MKSKRNFSTILCSLLICTSSFSQVKPPKLDLLKAEQTARAGSSGNDGGSNHSIEATFTRDEIDKKWRKCIVEDLIEPKIWPQIKDGLALNLRGDGPNDDFSDVTFSKDPEMNTYAYSAFTKHDHLTSLSSIQNKTTNEAETTRSEYRLYGYYQLWFLGDNCSLTNTDTSSGAVGDFDCQKARFELYQSNYSIANNQLLPGLTLPSLNIENLINYDEYNRTDKNDPKYFVNEYFRGRTDVGRNNYLLFKSFFNHGEALYDFQLDTEVLKQVLAKRNLTFDDIKSPHDHVDLSTDQLLQNFLTMAKYDVLPHVLIGKKNTYKVHESGMRISVGRRDQEKYFVKVVDPIWTKIAKGNIKLTITDVSEVFQQVNLFTRDDSTKEETVRVRGIDLNQYSKCLKKEFGNR